MITVLIVGIVVMTIVASLFQAYIIKTDGWDDWDKE